MTDQICNLANSCALVCLGRGAHADGYRCDTGHCDRRGAYCVPVTKDPLVALQDIERIASRGDVNIQPLLAPILEIARAALAPFHEVTG